jgi:hypothetical protein
MRKAGEFHDHIFYHHLLLDVRPWRYQGYETQCLPLVSCCSNFRRHYFRDFGIQSIIEFFRQAYDERQVNSEMVLFCLFLLLGVFILSIFIGWNIFRHPLSDTTSRELGATLLAVGMIGMTIVLFIISSIIFE